MRRSLVIITVFLLQAVHCLGQVFTGVQSTYWLTDDVTKNEAIKLATDEAKSQAIYATCGVEVSSYSLLRISDNEEYYKHKLTTNSYAVVRVYNKDVQIKKDRVIVTIDGEVFTAELPVPLFVHSLEKTYISYEDIKFSVTFCQDAYLKIFWFDDQTGEGGILYPQPGSYDMKFSASNSGVSFPFNDDVRYMGLIFKSLQTPEERVKPQNHYVNENNLPKPRNAGNLKTSKQLKNVEKDVSIVFVATQNKLPFNYERVNEENFLNWWCDIPISERALPVKKHITIKM